MRLNPTQQLLRREWWQAMTRGEQVVIRNSCRAKLQRSERQHIPERAATCRGMPPPIMTDAPPSTSDQYQSADVESVSVPSELSSDGTKLVYLYLQVTGESTLSELNRSLEIKTISLLPILDTLVTKDLVAREGNCYLPTVA